MTEAKKVGERERRLGPDEYDIYHDPIGVMHFLPPKRCETMNEMDSRAQIW